MTYLTHYQELSLGIKIASETHVNQYDKGGKAYILHPLHIMSKLLFDPQLATIGVLHDVIEDSNGEITIDYLISVGFSKRVTDALVLLTHDKKDPYIRVYIKKICSNYDAIRVKRKDLQHNSDITRLKGVNVKDIERMTKYHNSFIILTQAKRKFEK